jgi:xanthine/uracil permease
MKDTLLNAGGETSVWEVVSIKSPIVDIVLRASIEEFFTTTLLVVTRAVELWCDVLYCDVVLGVVVLFLGIVLGDVINSDFELDRILLSCTINKSFANSTFLLAPFTLRITLLLEKMHCRSFSALDL